MKIELEAVNTFFLQLLKNFPNRTTFSIIFIIRKISKFSSNLSITDITTWFFFKDFCYQVLTKIISNSWWFWSSGNNVSVGIAQDRFCQFCSEINVTTANHFSFSIFYWDLEYKIMQTLVKIIRLAWKLDWYQKTDTWITT